MIELPRKVTLAEIKKVRGVEVPGLGLKKKEATDNSRPTKFETQVNNSRPLKELGIKIEEPHERKDGGKIEYATMPQAIESWAEDPHGKSAQRLFSEAYGIPKREVRDFMKEAGLGEYLKLKDEGRLVTMVATQVPKPTYYFMTNALMAGELTRKGIPSALMVVEYPGDKFHSANSDKRGAFGKIDFPVGVEQDKEGKQRIKSVKLELKPYGIKHDDGRVERISGMDQANGYRCDQVLIQAIDARGPENQMYLTETKADDGSKTIKTAINAALGVKIPGLVTERKTVKNKEAVADKEGDAISITEFYKGMLEQTVTRLREAGELPSEADMPMIFVDGFKAYKELGKRAQPSEDFKKIAGFTSKEDVLKTVVKVPEGELKELIAKGDEAMTERLANQDLVLQENGLLGHTNGALDPASYYVGHTALPDLYFECSSCGGDYFVDKLARAQKVREHYDIPEKEVRLPDTEVPQLEEYVLHPTGKYLTDKVEIPDKVLELNARRELLQKSQQAGEITKQEYKDQAGPMQEEMTKIRQEATAEYAIKVEDFEGKNEQDQGFFIPEETAAVYKYLLEGTADTIQSDKVQKTIKELTEPRKREITVFKSKAIYL